MDNREFDVIIIGGGITGAGTARDCAMRGLKVLLVERMDIATGATGRNHGLLHSGARYAVTDRESAGECIKENMILRKIARHCIEETDGFFITLPEDDLEYQATFIQACKDAGIRAEAIDPEEARRIEPSVNPSITGAVRVPDGSVDPFRLCSANILDAKLHGAKVIVYSEVTRIIIEGRTVKGIEARDSKTGQKSEYYAPITVNAGGIWGHGIAQMAGVSIGMYPSKGSLLIFDHRVNTVVLNRCRKPANADILVPGDTVSVLGTTSTKIPFEECDNVRVTPDEVDLLLSEGEKLAPSLAQTRILRAYAGVRPLVASDDDPTGRSISRGIVLLDHGTRDGLEGLVSITGGKLMTYRLMGEWTADLVCKKLGHAGVCHTADTPLPGSEPCDKEEIKSRKLFVKAEAGRHGRLASRIPHGSKVQDSLVCECENVTVGEIEYAVENLDVHNLTDLRRRTRFGMGVCQGELCGCRAAGLLDKAHKCSDETMSDLKGFIEERWKGIYPVNWGAAIRENEYTQWVYSGLCGLGEYEPAIGKQR